MWRWTNPVPASHCPSPEVIPSIPHVRAAPDNPPTVDSCRVRNVPDTLLRPREWQRCDRQHQLVFSGWCYAVLRKREMGKTQQELVCLGVIRVRPCPLVTCRLSGYIRAFSAFQTTGKAPVIILLNIPAADCLLTWDIHPDQLRHHFPTSNTQQISSINPSLSCMTYLLPLWPFFVFATRILHAQSFKASNVATANLSTTSAKVWETHLFTR